MALAYQNKLESKMSITLHRWCECGRQIHSQCLHICHTLKNDLWLTRCHEINSHEVNWYHEINSHKVNWHQVNSHEVNSHEVNSHKVNSHKVNLPWGQLTFFNVKYYIIFNLNNSVCWYVLINSISIFIYFNKIKQNMVQNNRFSTMKNEFISWQIELMRLDLVASRLYESQSGGNWSRENW